MFRKVIVGAGGFGREAAFAAEAAKIDLSGFVVDARYGTPGTIVNGYPILGDLEWLASQADIAAFVAIGLPHLRAQIVGRMKEFSSFYNIVHPSVALSRWVEMGYGTIICAGSNLTTQIRIGNHVHINMNCTVGHDTVVGDHVTMAPGVHISGNVSIGKGVFLGVGAVVMEGIEIGAWSTVSMGAVITQNVASNRTVAGANRVIERREEGWHVG